MADIAVRAGDPGTRSYIESMTDQLADLVARKAADVDRTVNALDGAGGDNPKKLADYQRAFTVYAILTNAQTSIVKSLKDTDLAIIREFN